MTLTVLIPAHNEAESIGDCVEAVLVSNDLAHIDKRILVIANGCTDDTAANATALRKTAAGSGWTLEVIELETSGKLAALNAGDAAASDGSRVYLDADVRVSPHLLSDLVQILATPEPAFASGTPHVISDTWFGRAYARFWQRLPFITDTVPGFGVFAVNASGRERWQIWPDIIADDMFARLNFSKAERHQSQAPYDWPLITGFPSLVRVRRRQNDGVRELTLHYPDLLKNEDKPQLPVTRLLSLAVRDPFGFFAYASIAVAVRLPVFRSQNRWQRGR